MTTPVLVVGRGPSASLLRPALTRLGVPTRPHRRRRHPARCLHLSMGLVEQERADFDPSEDVVFSLRLEHEY